MRCHRTLEDWIFRPWITKMKEFIYEKLLQKKLIYRLCAQWRKTLRTTTNKSLRTCGACMGGRTGVIVAVAIAAASAAAVTAIIAATTGVVTGVPVIF
jgi:hypothetical protein